MIWRKAKCTFTNTAFPTCTESLVEFDSWCSRPSPQQPWFAMFGEILLPASSSIKRKQLFYGEIICQLKYRTASLNKDDRRNEDTIITSAFRCWASHTSSSPSEPTYYQFGGQQRQQWQVHRTAPCQLHRRHFLYGEHPAAALSCFDTVTSLPGLKRGFYRSPEQLCPSGESRNKLPGPVVAGTEILSLHTSDIAPCDNLQSFEKGEFCI